VTDEISYAEEILYRDEELKELLDMLNALMPENAPWRPTRARKEHVDLFGARIEPEEVYFKRTYGAAWGEDNKLSRESMKRLLWSIFEGNFGLQGFARRVAQERENRLMEMITRTSPLSRLMLGDEEEES
jgi:hypothetical protein